MVIINGLPLSAGVIIFHLGWVRAVSYNCLMLTYVNNCLPRFKHPSSAAQAAWASRCESVRKNVERTFGMLKKRFRLLSLPMLYSQHEPATKIDNVFKTACIIHNM